MKGTVFYCKGVMVMAISRVVKMGNQQLACASVPVREFATHELRDIITNMYDTMQAEGGVGIAAPQIGCNQRIMMFGFESNKRYSKEQAIPFTVLINPTIEFLSEEMVDGWEGCLSVPGLRGLVPRYQHIRYQGYDIEGQHIVRTVDAFHARVVQHEYDHLEGILYPQRIKDLRFFGFEEELVNIL